MTPLTSFGVYIGTLQFCSARLRPGHAYLAKPELTIRGVIFDGLEYFVAALGRIAVEAHQQMSVVAEENRPRISQGGLLQAAAREYQDIVRAVGGRQRRQQAFDRINRSTVHQRL